MPKSWSYVPPTDTPPVANDSGTERAPTAALNALEPANLEFAIRTPVHDLTSLIIPEAVRQRLETAIRLVKYHDVLFNQ